MYRSHIKGKNILNILRALTLQLDFIYFIWFIIISKLPLGLFMTTLT
jgi:hypothetical protein